ncbi:NAD-dependent epimerase/dehydratase family protein [Streptomyces sp. NPDC089424]|uniref:NAD-dependent epimerase/dehydratase family protein n=1 Tax=Streptomyces sp. NPDC089424 TaxID=3365917 RepID=UPI003823F7B8
MAHVLVTGGTGFLGSHTIARLLTEGHAVTTTLRSSARRPDVVRMLTEAGAPNPETVGRLRAARDVRRRRRRSRAAGDHRRTHPGQRTVRHAVGPP